MRTAAQRIAHYNARMQSTLIDPVLTAVNAAAVANFTAYAIDFVPKQSQMRTVLDNDGITGAIRLLYEAYNGEIYGLTKRYAGTALDAMAQALHDKYEYLGAASATLISIALNVYGITVT